MIVCAPRKLMSLSEILVIIASQSKTGGLVSLPPTASSLLPDNGMPPRTTASLGSEARVRDPIVAGNVVGKGAEVSGHVRLGPLDIAARAGDWP